MRGEFWRYRRGDLTRGEVASGFYYWTLGIVVTVLVVVGLRLLTPSGRSESNAYSGGPMPQLEQAVAVADTEFGHLSGGGWSDAWMLWSYSARRSVSEADFLRLNTECRPLLGVPYVIVESSMVDREHARITWSHGAESGADDMVYEDWAWHFVPDSATLAGLGPGADVERLVQERKAAGQCH